MCQRCTGLFSKAHATFGLGKGLCGVCVFVGGGVVQFANSSDHHILTFKRRGTLGLRPLLLFVLVLSGEPKQKQERGLVDRKLVQTPKFYCWLPKAALLFWLFGDFRCDVPLFIVNFAIYK